MPTEARAPRDPLVFLDLEMPIPTEPGSAPRSGSIFLGTSSLTGTETMVQKSPAVQCRNLLQSLGDPLGPTRTPLPGLQPKSRIMEAKPYRSDPEGVFDREAALAHLEGDAPLLEEVAGMFLEQAPEMLLQLRQSASAGDLAAVEFTAHALKGMGSSLEARAFTAEAHRMELAARERKVPGVMQALPDIERELARLLSGLAAFTKA